MGHDSRLLDGLYAGEGSVGEAAPRSPDGHVEVAQGVNPGRRSSLGSVPPWAMVFT